MFWGYNRVSLRKVLSSLQKYRNVNNQPDFQKFSCSFLSRDLVTGAVTQRFKDIANKVTQFSGTLGRLEVTQKPAGVVTMPP